MKKRVLTTLTLLTLTVSIIFQPTSAHAKEDMKVEKVKEDINAVLVMPVMPRQIVEENWRI